MWEIAKICESWVKYVGNVLNMQKMADICVKRGKYDGNGLDMWGKCLIMWKTA